MKKENQAPSEHVFDTLTSGKVLLSGRYIRVASGSSGKEAKIQRVENFYIASLRNSCQCHTRYFISKYKISHGYEYSLVPNQADHPPKKTGRKPLAKQSEPLL